MAIDVIEEFIELVSINSPSRKEGQLAAYLKKKLEEFGAKVIEDDSAQKTGSDTGNIIGIIEGNVPNAPCIMLSAHMDTVEETEGMVPVIRDGIIYSDGEHILGADDKAGIAIILAVLSEINEKKIPHGQIEVVFTVQEEVDLVGAKNLTYKLQSNFGYVLDADGQVGKVVIRTPTHITLDLVVTGKAAHAGVAPEQGINALVVAAKAIAEIPSGRLDKETTSNFGVIKGGKATNIVPDKVEIKAEVRSRNEDRLEAEVKRMIDVFSRIAKENGADFEYTQKLSYKAFQINENDPICTVLKKAGEK